jgi:ABC-type Na+ transport system ATPase subunit NatA
MVLSNKVEIDHLSKAYWVDRDDQSIQAFLDVTLHIREGEFMALLGPRAGAANHRCSTSSQG